MKNKSKSSISSRLGLRAFQNPRSLCLAALLVACGVVIAYFCKLFTIGTSIRITFENLPIILSGAIFGPISGLICGIAADFLNTAVSQYGLGGMNPILTLGAGSIGLAAGIMWAILPDRLNSPLKSALCVFPAHIVGNMLIKSFGLWMYYRTPFEVLIIRVPLYICIAAVEAFLFYIITKNPAIRKTMEAIK